MPTLEGVETADVVLGVGLFVVMLAASLLAAGVVIARLPVDYFVRDGHEACSIWRRVGRNVLGVLLVAVGVVLSVPGVPGQGLLTILVGVLLVDFPGKRRVERKLATRPAVLRGLNRVRSRFGRPPLEPPGVSPQPA